MRWWVFGVVLGCGSADERAGDEGAGGEVADEGAPCEYDGVTRQHGESFDDTDGCNTCTCEDGYASCTELGCEDTSR